jgi:hypothetical protein
MNPTHFLFALLLLSCGCTSAQVDLRYLKARWHTNQGHLFNSLAIGDSTIFVDNRADTIFTMRYKVSRDSLITWHPHTSQQFKNKILLLTKDSLVLDGIADVKERRNYSRVNSPK